MDFAFNRLQIPYVSLESLVLWLSNLPQIMVFVVIMKNRDVLENGILFLSIK